MNEEDQALIRNSEVVSLSFCCRNSAAWRSRSWWLRWWWWWPSSSVVLFALFFHYSFPCYCFHSSWIPFSSFVSHHPSLFSIVLIWFITSISWASSLDWLLLATFGDLYTGITAGRMIGIHAIRPLLSTWGRETAKVTDPLPSSFFFMFFFIYCYTLLLVSCNESIFSFLVSSLKKISRVIPLFLLLQTRFV